MVDKVPVRHTDTVPQQPVYESPEQPEGRAIMETVIVTGGAGYIGSHTCKALARAGYTPVAFDNLSRGHRDLVKWGPLVRGDLLDTEALNLAFEAHKPVAVVHFAALAYVGESFQEPGLYYRNNVVGTLNLLDAVVAHGVRSIVFSSSCATYGVPDNVPIPEDHRQNPINPYGNTKLACERAIKDYAAGHGMRYALLRYFNAAGADPEGEAREHHDPETHLIPLALRAARGGDTLRVFGDDYPTVDGTCVRDYVHVTDLADAHVRALERLTSGGDSIACNLGTGTGSSVREVIDTVEKVTGSPVVHEINPRRPGDPPELVAAPGLARQALGWTPKRSGLRQMVEDSARAAVAAGAVSGTGT